MIRAFFKKRSRGDGYHYCILRNSTKNIYSFKIFIKNKKPPRITIDKAKEFVFHFIISGREPKHAKTLNHYSDTPKTQEEPRNYPPSGSGGGGRASACAEFGKKPNDSSAVISDLSLLKLKNKPIRDNTTSANKFFIYNKQYVLLILTYKVYHL